MVKKSGFLLNVYAQPKNLKGSDTGIFYLSFTVAEID